MVRASKYVFFLTAFLLLLSVNSITAAYRTSTYRVTITNLTSGQPFTPPAIALHRGRLNVFHVGQPASLGVKEIAENGNLTPFVDSLTANPRVTNVVVAIAGDPPPLFPGQSVTVDIEAGYGARFLSTVAMLICTNDGFSGASSLRLPLWVGERVRHYAVAYDAGTEINTEDFADLVPPCPALTGVPSDEPGTGVSNPALAQNGVVRRHRNIKGIADLIPAIHSWREPVMKIEVLRIA
jgi:hypothetical protein